MLKYLYSNVHLKEAKCKTQHHLVNKEHLNAVDRAVA
jgi:hypothetical protein